MSVPESALIDPRTIRVAQNRPSLQPGFFFACSNVDLPRCEPLMRMYWNISGADAAVSLIGLITEELNHAEEPFDLKVACSRAVFERTDAAVLYLPAAGLARTAATLRRISDVLARTGCLGEGTPMWTLQVARGVGVAEDPGGRVSFGQVRAEQAARAIVNSGASSNPPRRLHEAEREFEAMGVALAAPHRRQGSSWNDEEFLESWSK
ncbi:T3SS effector HopA1 family protein [Streptomyces tanashiensis]|uniref:T3SS effector HopA1 family protein n=1 Tax=Streptomyces tanashiensis TaxID=67367 RepID=UPI0033FFEC9E